MISSNTPGHCRLRSGDTGFAQGIAIGQFDSGGLAISVDQVRENYKKKGLCVTCGKVKTHNKKTSLTSGFYMAPLTKDGEVYEGYCLKCHSIEEVMERPEVRAKLEKGNRRPRISVLHRVTSAGHKNGHHGHANPAAQRQNLLRGGKSGGNHLPPGSSGNLTRDEPTRRKSGLSSTGKSRSLRSIDGSSEGTGRSNRSLNATSTEESHEVCLNRTIDEVIESMLRESSNPAVQAQGCAELSRMNSQPSDFLIGAIDAIVDAMNTHTSDDRVQKEGCRAFRRYTTRGGGVGHSCSAGDDIDVDVDCCSKIMLQGGGYAVLAALRAHQNSRTIQREGIRVVRNVLCALSDSRNVVVESEGIELIIRAMWSHSELSSTQEDGCVILWSLAYDDANSQSIILENNGVGAILNAMTLFPKQERVQYHGCGALHTLSANEALKQNILDNGGFDVILSATRAYGTSEVVAEKAFGALVNLIVSTGDISGNKLCVMNGNEIQVLVSTMQTHASSCRVQKVACYLLEIAARSRTNLEVLRRNDIVRSVLISATELFPEECSGSTTYVLNMLD